MNGQMQASVALPPGSKPSTNHAGGFVGPRAGLVFLRGKKYLTLAGMRTALNEPEEI
jgi:hypothetical protein